MTGITRVLFYKFFEYSFILLLASPFLFYLLRKNKSVESLKKIAGIAILIFSLTYLREVGSMLFVVGLGILNLELIGLLTDSWGQFALLVLFVVISMLLTGIFLIKRTSNKPTLIFSLISLVGFIYIYHFLKIIPSLLP